MTRVQILATPTDSIAVDTTTSSITQLAWTYSRQKLGDAINSIRQSACHLLKIILTIMVIGGTLQYLASIRVFVRPEQGALMNVSELTYNDLQHFYDAQHEIIRLSEWLNYEQFKVSDMVRRGEAPMDLSARVRADFGLQDRDETADTLSYTSQLVLNLAAGTQDFCGYARTLVSSLIHSNFPIAGQLHSTTSANSTDDEPDMFQASACPHASLDLRRGSSIEKTLSANAAGLL